MKINLNIIREELPEGLFLEIRCDEIETGRLTGVTLWDGAGCSMPHYAYIISAEGLGELDDSSIRSVSFIIIGLPAKSVKNSIHYISVADFYSKVQLLQIVQKIFDKYNYWDYSLLRSLNSPDGLNKTANIIYNFVGLPFMLCNGANSIIMNEYDHNNEESCTMYSAYSDKHYAYDELNVIYSNKFFIDTLKNKDTFIFPKGIWRYRYMCRYVYHRDKKIGLIIFGEDYRPFRTSDRVIISYLSNVLRPILEEESGVAYPTSFTFDDMIQDLLVRNKKYVHNYDRVLGEKHWWQNDTFRVYLIEPHKSDASPYIIYNAIIMGNMFTEVYLSVKEKELLLILDINIEGNKLNSEISALEHFLRESNFTACASNDFSNFANLKLYYMQAQSIFSNGLVRRGKCITLFKDVVQEVMVRCCLDKYPADFFMPEGYKELLKKYIDSGEPLFMTLKVYIENDCNASATARILQIHLNTLKYRIGKIEEALNLRLDDSSTRHYLYSLLQMSDI